MRNLGSGSFTGLNNHIETMREVEFYEDQQLAAYRYLLRIIMTTTYHLLKYRL